MLCIASQGQPLHGPDFGEAIEYPPAALANPAVLNSLSDQGLCLLHLAAGLGYDWACNTLINNGADVQLRVGFTLVKLCAGFNQHCATICDGSIYQSHLCSFVQQRALSV